MGERQTAALRPEQDQGAPREARRVSTSRPPAGCTPPPVSRVPCRELPLSLRASSERGAVGRVRRRKDKSTSFSGSPSPAPPQRPAWLLQALTQKQLPSLSTRGVAERYHTVWLKSGKPSPWLPLRFLPWDVWLPVLSSAGGGWGADSGVERAPGAQGPRAGPHPACWEGRSWRRRWSAAGSALFSSLTLE